ncbi:MAG: ABC transporter ATP-binding protein, partial [Erysipelotrichaceae bacterium]|nr:ABC transporter ATP-binding protein [Erysipelotrichaceae bacterium]
MPPRQRVITDKKIDMKSLKRLLIYVFRNYKFHLLIVAVCLIISSVTNVIAATFLQRLIDEVITPGISSGIEAVAGDLLKLITTMASLYVIGILATTLYNQLMAGVGQGTIKKLRDAMFDNMETLPIRYFDTHSHGEIMST